MLIIHHGFEFQRCFLEGDIGNFRQVASAVKNDTASAVGFQFVKRALYFR